MYKHAGDDDTEPVDFHTSVTFEDVLGSTFITMRSTFDSVEKLQKVIETYGADEGAKQMLSRLDAFLASHNN